MAEAVPIHLSLFGAGPKRRLGLRLGLPGLAKDAAIVERRKILRASHSQNLAAEP
jgi:hypothetical protein